MTSVSLDQTKHRPRTEISKANNNIYSDDVK